MLFPLPKLLHENLNLLIFMKLHVFFFSIFLAENLIKIKKKKTTTSTLHSSSCLEQLAMCIRPNLRRWIIYPLTLQ